MCLVKMKPVGLSNPFRNRGWQEKLLSQQATNERVTLRALAIIAQLESERPAECLPKISCLMQL